MVSYAQSVKKDLVPINSGESPARFLRGKSSVPSIINSPEVI